VAFIFLVYFYLIFIYFYSFVGMALQLVMWRLHEVAEPRYWV